MLLLNADVGEGIDVDNVLTPFLTFANIACGGHAGNRQTITQTIKLAKKYNVKIGAHPSYIDKENFGRVSHKLPIADLEKLLQNQIDFFTEQANVLNMDMHHIKLHGALYNDVFANNEMTYWFLNWCQKKYPKAKIFVPLAALTFVPDSFKKIVLIEAFADRNYSDNLQLISRKESNACLESIEEVEKHVRAIMDNKLITLKGKVFKVQVDTLCLHGDYPKVLEFAKIISNLI